MLKPQKDKIKLSPDTAHQDSFESQTPGGQLDVQQAGHGAPDQEQESWQS